jgi:hypothetical protein
VSEDVTMSGMDKHNPKTVPVYARLAPSDVSVIDRIAGEELITRSNLIFRIIRTWIKEQERSSNKS